MSASRKLFIKSFGCQMNAYDSERMGEALAAEGYVAAESADDADMILLNTCHIREKATEKIYSELGRFRPLKDARPDLKIGVTGCVAQAEGAEIFARQPMVDMVVGPQSYHKLPELERMVRTGKRALDTDFPQEDKFDHLPKRSGAARGPTAFLTVQEGCDKFCAFCVVPYTRGAESSRPAGSVMAEARGLVARGVREITLLGQNVNAYRGHEDGLAGLIRELAEIDELARIRFTTSHPSDMSGSLIATFGEVEKLMPYLHLPVQSGSDMVLKAMNRKHTAEQYMRTIERVRASRPDILLSGDFIVGFPGETEADFEDTLALVEEVGYGQAYSFKYSPRTGTPAAELDGVDEAIKDQRLQRLQTILTRQQRAAQESMVGRTVSVLFERPGRLPGQVVGKSEYLHAVHVAEGQAVVGEIRPVRICASGSNSLSGEVLRG
ncbi:MAG: tRNA (N6-isopentenyl adenosine(37)-C2)-methylthiotransferase MiaB [Boseongicola sp. SB0664_bin_43]|uniref:tRNA-2-methylthio-N(6)-dimethylallyladenosine synthase n=1 Tax=Boseongicola sp. SB0664_bin_43 TaxID=2604844 RepID=A0A6B0Y557_9RHOB|nr:tRNA (N6-isopentenyl adenosine(37)-C2)-methylthiotransferase MiaB [Boseongicola sp. SB0664_bin_43]MYK31571.1 tRNA (N6-isopentenyl adenosine(37)-C2)-methylthiotransferase MiaB [Boseongicola sp. SB0670_bin_30]